MEEDVDVKGVPKETNKKFWTDMSEPEKTEEWARLGPIAERVGRELASNLGLEGEDTIRYGQLYSGYTRGFLNATDEMINQTQEKGEPIKGRWLEEQALLDFIGQKATEGKIKP